MKKLFLILIIIIINSLVNVNCQTIKEYYNAGLSYSGGTHINNALGRFTYHNYLATIGYNRKLNRQMLPFSKTPNLFNVGWGFQVTASEVRYKAKEFRQSKLSYEITPSIRLFILQQWFIELGYSLEYFKTTYALFPNPSSSSLYILPRNMGFESGLSPGIGYLINLTDFIAIETRVTVNMNNYVKSETAQGITDDLIRNIRFIICVNYIRTR